MVALGLGVGKGELSGPPFWAWVVAAGNSDATSKADAPAANTDLTRTAIFRELIVLTVIKLLCCILIWMTWSLHTSALRQQSD